MVCKKLASELGAAPIKTVVRYSFKINRAVIFVACFKCCSKSFGKVKWDK